MKSFREIPRGILSFVIFIIIFNVIYFYYFGYYLLYEEGYLQLFLSITPFSLFLWVDVLFSGSALVIIPYGFLNKKKWAWFFALIFLGESACGAIAYIMITKDVLLRYSLFVMYIIFIMYLLMSDVKKYFTLPSKTSDVYRYGEFTLYRKEIPRKNGAVQIFYFFSKHPSEKGIPSSMPDDYEMHINVKTGVPYLKKKEKKQ